MDIMGASALLCLFLAAFMYDFSIGVHGGYVGIVNGTVAKQFSRRYMVSVQKVMQNERQKGMQHHCGGFLVAKSFVMTAAHCVIWGVNLTVVVGCHDIRKSCTRISVKYYHINPGYNSDTLQNDIALLQLEEVAPKSDSDLIHPPKKDKSIAAETVCSVAGWGATKTNGPANHLLLQADVVIMKRKKCMQFWNSTYFSAKNLCTSGGAGFCQGDSGGPLVCKNEAVGIVSYNQEENCDNPTRPNVYTKISSFLPWINSILKSVKH